MKVKQKHIKKIKKPLKKTLIPHKANQHRPYLVRRHGVVALVALVLLLQVVYNYATTGKVAVLGQTANVRVSELLKGVNQERKTSGLNELQVDEKLNKAAFMKAQDMLEKGYWAHESPDGVQPWQWFSKAGYSYDIAGENLAKNFTTSQGAVNAWMRSPDHKANVLGEKYDDIGLAVVNGKLNGEDTTLIVSLYGSKADSAGVAGVNNEEQTFNQATQGSANPLTNFGSALQTLNPAALGGIVILLLGFLVASLAHLNRHKLPLKIRKSWRLHHGLYKAGIFLSLALLLFFAAIGGQI
ncbi:hypothetical protein KC939_01020 [Candidatus Saccharibacteria bacterium]|nr:hypothetical protein [Candidatus Saccharibacteria bacterium]